MPAVNRLFLFTACLLWFCGPAWADAEVWGGKPSLGLEFEHQKMAFGAGHANSLTLVPSLSFKEGFIHKVELMLEGERENNIQDGINEKVSLCSCLEYANPST